MASHRPPSPTSAACAPTTATASAQSPDTLGVNKNVEIPAAQFDKALAGDIMFDGSSIEGFVRIEESDMLLAPDLSTFRVLPWGDSEARVARIICDITMPDGSPFAG